MLISCVIEDLRRHLQVNVTLFMDKLFKNLTSVVSLIVICWFTVYTDWPKFCVGQCLH